MPYPFRDRHPARARHALDLALFRVLKNDSKPLSYAVSRPHRTRYGIRGSRRPRSVSSVRSRTVYLLPALYKGIQADERRSHGNQRD
jgi:hypothetical protein